jgi:predicted small secreted protein
MKKLPFRISLDSPCSEELNNMQDTSCGKFCNSCQKEVYDFTKLTDNEIYKIMQANNGEVCGKLTSEQLKNGFTYTEETYSNTAWLKYAASILFMGGITNAFSQSTIWEFKPTKTEQALKNTSKDTKKDSLNIQGSLINAITNKPLTYPMLVEIQSENTNLTQTISSDTGSFNIIISNKENLDKIRVILHYQNSKDDTIQVPKEHVSFEKLENVNEYRLVLRTAVNSQKILKKNIGYILGGMSMRTVKGTYSKYGSEYIIVDGVKIRRENVSLEDEPYNSSNGTPANLESKPIDPNLQNR